MRPATAPHAVDIDVAGRGLWRTRVPWRGGARSVATPAATHDRRLGVTVLDACPIRRRGLCSVVSDAGMTVAADGEPGVRTWPEAPDAVVLGIPRDVAPECARGFVHCVRAHPVVVVADHVDRPTLHGALLAGARGVLPACPEPSVLRAALLAAVAGLACTPAAGLREPSAEVARDTEPLAIRLDEHERRWLQRLADGATVDVLAEESAYSPREMHRLLGALYARLGTPTRTRALVTAARLGLIG